MVPRKTKIVATVGPASQSEEVLSQLIQAGVDVFRLNFSHGTHEEHGEAIRAIRQLAGQDGRPVAILQDLQGPRLRTGPLADGTVDLRVGQTFVLTTELVEGASNRVSVNYADLPHDLTPGDTVLVADGAIELRVMEVAAPEIRTTVVRGGQLGEQKGLNLPGVRLNTPALTDKDLADLEFGVAQGVDIIALSFVREAQDLHAVRAALARLKARIPVVAKIETKRAIDHLDSVLRASDGVMVARGDLGVEIGVEKVPMIQKLLLRKASEHRIPSITATQMLESMVTRPIPTRAEASDIANAILDGTDALMLSAETTLGQFPVAAVQTMDQIARETELAQVRPPPVDVAGEAQAISLARATVWVAEQIKARAIVVFTKSGLTAQLLSKEWPSVPIYAFTSSESVHRRLALWRGVTPLLEKFIEDTDALITTMLGSLQRKGLVQDKERVVLARFSPARGRGLANFITIRRVVK